MKKRVFNAFLTDEQHAQLKYHCTIENVRIMDKLTELILEWLKEKEK